MSAPGQLDAALHPAAEAVRAGTAIEDAAVAWKVPEHELRRHLAGDTHEQPPEPAPEERGTVSTLDDTDCRNETITYAAVSTETTVSTPPPGDGGLLAGLRNGAWLDAQTFPPLAYAVPGVIAEGCALLIGPPKIGKSWMVLDLALAVAAGGCALGAVGVPHRRVLYLALEDGDRRMQNRCRTLLDGAPIPSTLDYLTAVQSGHAVATIAAWLDRYGQDAPLVILDTLGKVMPPATPGESSYQRDYRMGSALKRVVDAHPGTALVINHHDRKAAAEDFVDSVSGTHGLAGAADTIIVLARPRQQEDGTLKVTGRDVDEGEYAVTFGSGGRWTLHGGGLDAAAEQARTQRATANLGDRSGDIVHLVEAHPDGIRPGTIGHKLNMSAKDAGQYLRRLAVSGRIYRARRGLYTPVESGGSVETPGHGHRLLSTADMDSVENRSNTDPNEQEDEQP